MSSRRQRLVTLVTSIAAVVVPLAAGAAQAPPARFGDGLCALAAGRCTRPVLAVLGAFPAELEPLIARASIRETLVIGDRVLRVGTIAGVPVVLGLLGIGFANARDATRLVLAHFDVAGLVVSGVAGSPRRIGDVVVPETWTGPDGVPYAADVAMLKLARAVTAAGVALERCTPVPPEPPGPTVCVDFEPGVFVAGTGETSDPYGERVPRCIPDGGDVFGCDVQAAATTADVARGVPSANAAPDAVDMETAAAAREATASGVPYIAFRAVSDGTGDPLELPGFPAQFFAYYRLAARNAAAATAAFVERWGRTRRLREGALRDPPLVRASCGWERHATTACAGRQVPRALRARVDRACRLLASDDADQAASRAWLRAARLADTPAVRPPVGRPGGRALAGVLRERVTQ